MAFGFGDIIAMLGIAYSTIVGAMWIVPRLNARCRTYYIFLMAWAVPYVIGYACDAYNTGPQWAQGHLLDISYVQWSTTLGVAFYTNIRQLQRRTLTQRSILIASGVSLVAFTIMGYGWEVLQTAQVWYAGGSLNGAIDWMDYASFAVGVAAAVVPFLVLPRLMSVSRPS